MPFQGIAKQILHFARIVVIGAEMRYQPGMPRLYPYGNLPKTCRW